VPDRAATVAISTHDHTFDDQLHAERVRPRVSMFMARGADPLEHVGALWLTAANA